MRSRPHRRGLLRTGPILALSHFLSPPYRRPIVYLYVLLRERSIAKIIWRSSRQHLPVVLHRQAGLVLFRTRFPFAPASRCHTHVVLRLL